MPTGGHRVVQAQVGELERRAAAVGRDHPRRRVVIGDGVSHRGSRVDEGDRLATVGQAAAEIREVGGEPVLRQGTDSGRSCRRRDRRQDRQPRREREIRCGHSDSSAETPSPRSIAPAPVLVSSMNSRALNSASSSGAWYISSETTTSAETAVAGAAVISGTGTRQPRRPPGQDENEHANGSCHPPALTRECGPPHTWPG